MNAVDFKPSQVVLSVPPLTDTMKSTEVECAAAYFVRACQALGDTWQSVTREQLNEVLKADYDAKTEPMWSLMQNPFCRPYIFGLIEGGYAVVDDEETKATRFTEAGLEALRKWVRA